MKSRCPFCLAESSQSGGSYVNCPKCGSFAIHWRLADEIENGQLFAETRHFVACWLRNHKKDPKLRSPNFRSPEDVQAVIDQCPMLPRERQASLFRFAVGKTEFGKTATITFDELEQAAYGRTDTDCIPLLYWLEEAGLIDALKIADHKANFRITSKGYDAYYEESFGRGLTVFISSTCYDLVDLRFELASHLESKGHSVKLSEDPERFAVDPLDNSIETCLRNLEISDVVICVLDRRYGGILKQDPYAGKSATHVEVLHAWSIRKPVFFFMRDRAWQDYSFLRDNPDAEVKWVDSKGKATWMGFVREIAAIPEHTGRSNWVTLFKSSTDLKTLVERRLFDFSHPHILAPS